MEATQNKVASIRNTYIAIAGIHGIELLVYIYFWIVAYSFYRQLKEGGQSASASPVNRF